ncbi:MAG: acetyl-CoA carboxylase carboxyltransferase subunit beta [Chloroflexi bacterium]|nr:acetyl-CoA carboxylase carboxyltransferase subunit beta [Chloroflexota bacterium]
MRLRVPFVKRSESAQHLWTQCPHCGEMLFNKQLARNLNVCTKCEHHFRVGARERIEQLADRASFAEIDPTLVSMDPLGFVDQKPYPARIAESQAKTAERDAVVCGDATIGGHPVTLAAMEFSFMGGSMGTVVGEKLARAAEHARDGRRGLVIVSASGGARMQEGTIALMQLVKTVAAVTRHGKAGLPFVSVLTDPTTGGVLASYASLGDVILAEPGALIGFSGARVTSSTIGAELPEGFQRAEFLLRHGFVDQVVPRAQLRDRIAFFLGAFSRPAREMRWGV